MNSRDVEAAAKRLQGNIHNVKVTSSKTFSAMSGCDLFLQGQGRLQQAGAAEGSRQHASGHREQRGQSRTGGKLCERTAGHAGDDRDAQEHADRQGDGHQRIWR